MISCCVLVAVGMVLVVMSAWQAKPVLSQSSTVLEVDWVAIQGGQIWIHTILCSHTLKVACSFGLVVSVICDARQTGIDEGDLACGCVLGKVKVFVWVVTEGTGVSPPCMLGSTGHSMCCRLHNTLASVTPPHCCRMLSTSCTPHLQLDSGWPGGSSD